MVKIFKDAGANAGGTYPGRMVFNGRSLKKEFQNWFDITAGYLHTLEDKSVAADTRVVKDSTAESQTKSYNEWLSDQPKVKPPTVEELASLNNREKISRVRAAIQSAKRNEV